MKRIVFGLITVLALVRPAAAQTYDYLHINIWGAALMDDGGEQRRVGNNPTVVIGRGVSSAISVEPERGCFGAASRVDETASGAWLFTTTPIRVQADAVTFRLVWARFGDKVKSAGGDSELTLRPGESLPIDIIELPAPSRCGFKRALLRASVDYWPTEEYEPSVIAADLWVVQKPGGGGPNSEQLEVRGRPHRAIPFFFKTITDKGVSLDLYGEMTVHPRNGFNEVRIETYSRLTEGGQTTQTMSANVPGMPGLYGARKVESTIQMKPGEVISVELPRLTENTSGAFANQTLAITIRERQIR